MFLSLDSTIGRKTVEIRFAVLGIGHVIASEQRSDVKVNFHNPQCNKLNFMFTEIEKLLTMQGLFFLQSKIEVF